MAPSQSKTMEVRPEEYDISFRLAPFLDRQMIFPIMMFHQEKNVYDINSSTRAMVELLSKTDMYDFMFEQMAATGDLPTEEQQACRQRVLDSAKTQRAKVLPLLERLEDEETYAEIQKISSLDDLCDKFELEYNILDDLFAYAKMLFNQGNYEPAERLLAQYRNLVLIGERDKAQGDQMNDRQNYLLKVAESGLDPKKYINATWGVLASHILDMNWKDAAECACQLDQMIAIAYENIETRSVPNSYGKLEQRQIETCRNESLQQRTWLSHWILFILFRVEWGTEQLRSVEANLVQSWTKLVDIFLNEKNMSIMALTSPHLLRYAAALLILYNKKFKHLMRDIVSVIHAEAESYNDPITNFLLALYVNMDFDDAQVQLQNCYHVCQVDYFLDDRFHYKTFLENARLLIFESYCRVHQYIDITMIAEKLQMEPDVAEIWIVNLIQSAKLQARIDLDNNRVLMAKENPSAYQQVIDKTKSVNFRTTLVQANAANVAKIVEKKPIR